MESSSLIGNEEVFFLSNDRFHYDTKFGLRNSTTRSWKHMTIGKQALIGLCPLANLNALFFQPVGVSRDLPVGSC